MSLRNCNVNTEGRLTILTPIHLQSESNPPSGVPVQRNEMEVAGYHWLFKFVLDHSVSIIVAWKSLKLHNNMLVCLIFYIHFNVLHSTTNL